MPDGCNRNPYTMSIMTKTGDKGQTGLYNGERVPKNHLRIEAVGTLDELNAHLGLLRSMGGHESLEVIQSDLFELGGLLATPGTKAGFKEPLRFLDVWAQEVEASLPPLQNFILPGGHLLSAQAHVARTVCRRAERLMVQLTPLPQDALPYINRLSDFLFLLARKFNLDTKTDEVLWTKS